jgi:predicted metal-dependent phosphoesterase TrpH
MHVLATLEREIDRLYALPLDEFTSSRNDLARRLKDDGEKDAAEQVAALPKPSVPVWTINQLARQDKAAVKALLDAAAKLRKAQERALAGGDPGALRAAQADEREAIRDLTQRAGEILEQAGRPASRAALERIRQTLGAAALADPARNALKAGRLTDELEMSGFDALTGLQPATKRAQPKDELAERREKKAEQQRELRRLQKQARDLDDRAKSAEAEADEAEEAAEAARELAAERRRDADAAAADLAEFERTLN